ncbi:MAG: hypothetical protein ABSG61_15020 [Gemmatimonadales bacterium]
MNRFKLMPAAAALCAALAVPRAHAQEITLRFAPPVGQVVHYRTITQSWLAGMGGPDTTVPATQTAMYMTRTVTGMDGDARVVATVVDSSLTEMPGMPGMAAMIARVARDAMRGMTITQKIDARGRVLSSDVKLPQGAPAQSGQGTTRTPGRIGPVFPEGPVHPGDTWTDSMITSTSAGRGQQVESTVRLTLKLERVEQQGGSRVAIVSVNGTVQADSVGGAARQGLTAGTMTGEMAIEVETGRVTRSTSDLQATMQTQRGPMPTRSKTTMEALP